MEIPSFSDETIRSWMDFSYSPEDRMAIAQNIHRAIQHIQEVPDILEERIQAILDCMKMILREMPVISGYKKFLFGVKAQIKHVYNQAQERGADQAFQEACRLFIGFVDHVLQIRFPRPELRIAEDQIQEPTEAMRSANLMDPMSLEALSEGTVYAFHQAHFVGSHETLQEMIQRGTRGSNVEAVFVPLQNRLVSLEDLQWIRW